MTQAGRESGFCQGSQGAQLFVVEDHRFGLATQHRHDAVVACRGFTHDAGIARDGDGCGVLLHVSTVTKGCTEVRRRARNLATPHGHHCLREY